MKNIDEIQLSDKQTIVDLLMDNSESYWRYIDTDIYESLVFQTNLRSSIYYRILLSISSNIHILLIIYDICMSVLYSVILLLCGNKKNIPKIDKSEIYTHTYHHRWISINKKQLRNIFYDDVICLLPNNLINIPIYDYTYNPNALIVFFHMLSHYSPLTIPMIHYVSPSIWKEELMATRKFKKIYNKLISDNNWMSQISLNYGISSINLKQLLKYELVFMLPFCIKYNLLLDRLFSKRKPTALFLVSEQTPQGRGWIKIGSKYNTPSIALQHGSMARDDYVYNQSEIIPNLTLVWSKYEMDVLVNYAKYPTENVLVVGNPRFDILSSSNELYSKNKFVKKYALNQNHKLILWAPEFFGNNEAETQNYLTEIFSALQDLTDITLLIKPHPVDGIEYLPLIDKYMKLSNVPVIIMPKDSNISELIYISDLIIIKTSTVGEEAVILHKPIIEFNLDEQKVWRNYVHEGVAVGVYSKGILKQTINEILYHQSPISRESQDKYITNHMYDGEASKRVSNIIVNVISHQC